MPPLSPKLGCEQHPASSPQPASDFSTCLLKDENTVKGNTVETEGAPAQVDPIFSNQLDYRLLVPVLSGWLAAVLIPSLSARSVQKLSQATLLGLGLGLSYLGAKWWKNYRCFFQLRPRHTFVTRPAPNTVGGASRASATSHSQRQTLASRPIRIAPLNPNRYRGAITKKPSNSAVPFKRIRLAAKTRTSAARHRQAASWHEWQRPGISWLIVLSLLVVLAINFNIAQLNKLYSADGLLKAWQGGQTQFQITATVQTEPRTLAPKTSPGQPQSAAELHFKDQSAKSAPNQPQFAKQVQLTGQTRLSNQAQPSAREADNQPRQVTQLVSLRLQTAAYGKIPPFLTRQPLQVFAQNWPALTPGTTLRTSITLPRSQLLRAREPYQAGISQYTTPPTRVTDFYGQLTANTHHPPQILAPPSGLAAWRNHTKESISQALSNFPNLRSLGPALILGIRQLPPELEENFKTVGLLHLVCISGLHVAILLSWLEIGLAFFPTYLRILLSLLGLAGYTWYVGASPPVVRAALMAGIYLLAFTLGRPQQAFSALQIALLGMLLYAPQQAQEIGFYLSVAATAAIILGTKAFPLASKKPSRPTRRHARPKTAAWGRLFSLPQQLWAKSKAIIQVTTLAQLACLPALVLLRPVLPTYAICANLCCVPVIGLLVGGLALFALCHFLFPPLAQLLASGLELLASWITQNAQLFSGWPGANLPWPGGGRGAATLILLESGLLYMYWHWQQKKASPS